MTCRTYIEVEDLDLPITVEWTGHKSTRGKRDQWGAQIEPDEPAEIEIDRVTDCRGGDVCSCC